MRPAIIILTSVLAISGCASKEYRAEKLQCSAAWRNKIPPRYEQEMYNQIQSRQVPTGQTNCTTTGYGYTAYTSCTQVMRTEYFTVPAVRTVDRNAARRDAKILSCTINQCLKKYGNKDCES